MRWQRFSTVIAVLVTACGAPLRDGPAGAVPDAATGDGHPIAALAPQ